MKQLIVLAAVALGLAGTAAAAEMAPPVTYDAQACEAHLRANFGDADMAKRRTVMAAALVDYVHLSEEALAMRAGAIRLHRELKAKTDARQPLSGHDLKRLNGGAAQLLAQRSALLRIAEAYECWVYAALPLDQEELALRATGVAISLSAALLLYDNYLLAIAPFRKDHDFRQHLNRADAGFDIDAGTLNRIAMNFGSVENRVRTRNALEWWTRHGASLLPAPFEHYEYLSRSIAQSPSLHLVRQESLLRDVGKPFALLGTLTVDGLFSLKNEGTNLTSLLFGNAVGLVETRRGKLYGRQEIAHHVAGTLRAGDILVEKTPFRLTDVFIPGHWGHAAIWVGTETELRALGIWEHPVVRPHHAAIRAGRGVVEALRSGVEMNPLAHFLNVDDLAVLRHETGATADTTQQAEIVLHTLRQVGKAYDFNFDAETTHRIFCSKLVYLAYGDLQWPTSRILGKTTVSPDDIARRAVGDGPLAVVLLYHNGQETPEPRQHMERLVKPERVARLQVELAE
jgi:uncharacterized protein YycO